MTKIHKYNTIVILSETICMSLNDLFFFRMLRFMVSAIY